MAEESVTLTTLAAMLTTMNENMATKDDIKSLKKKVKDLQKSQKELESKTHESIKDLERRFKARENFPPPSPLYGNAPRPTQTPTSSSVSKPIWGKRSIFG